MDAQKKSPWHDLSSEEELRPIDMALDALKKLKLGLGKMELAVCMYEREFECRGEDPYEDREHPFKTYIQIHTKVDKLSVLVRKIVKYKIASASSNNKVLKMPL